MYNIYQVVENVVIYISRNVVYRIVLPLIFVFLVIDIIKYLFTKDSKKEDILEALKAKAIGFTVLIFLPFILLWFLSFLQAVTGIKPDVDTSVLQKLTGGKTITQTISKSANTTTITPTK